MSPRLPGPPPLDPATQAAYEAQAEACLLAAEQYRAPLLALATKLTGCPEEGMDLFQQAALDCHDAIQRRGFDQGRGGQYRFYLYTALRHLHYKRQRAGRVTVPLDFRALDSNDDHDEDEVALGGRGALRQALSTPPGPAPLTAEAELAEQVANEVRGSCTPRERVVLRLHAEGHSCQEIVELTGWELDRRRVHEQLQRLKARLHRTFFQAWQALGEATYCLLL